MTLAIFTLVEHIHHKGKLYGYAPYVREMNLWTSHFEEIIVVAPLAKKTEIDAIEMSYTHSNIKHISMPVFNIKTIDGILGLILKLPLMCYRMLKVMRKANHLHFRSPSNIAAIASILQVGFPKKPKTMRYAGNWDPESNQPLGYKFQKYVFSNSFLTRNIKVLVYGNWPEQSKNIQPFYAATFSNNDKVELVERNYSSKLKFIFVGALVSGKQPLFTIQTIEKLRDKGVNCCLDIFGDGPLKFELKEYVQQNNLKEVVNIHGNIDKEALKPFLQISHFIILPSKSEGWPKALAEGMFYGCIPIATTISCVPWMLDNGNRGLLIDPELDRATAAIFNLIRNGELNAMSKASQSWSQKYTIEKQAEEIDKILSL